MQQIQRKQEEFPEYLLPAVTSSVTELREFKKLCSFVYSQFPPSSMYTYTELQEHNLITREAVNKLILTFWGDFFVTDV